MTDTPRQHLIAVTREEQDAWLDILATVPDAAERLRQAHLLAAANVPADVVAIVARIARRGVPTDADLRDIAAKFAARPVCADHLPVQHRDGKPPWCRTCGLTAAYSDPNYRNHWTGRPQHPGSRRDADGSGS